MCTSSAEIILVWISDLPIWGVLPWQEIFEMCTSSADNMMFWISNLFILGALPRQATPNQLFQVDAQFCKIAGVNRIH